MKLERTHKNSDLTYMILKSTDIPSWRLITNWLTYPHKNKKPAHFAVIHTH